MKKRIQKVGKFYSGIIMKYIGIFLFVGLVSVCFGKNGWYPYEAMSNISGTVYDILLPCLIGFAAGEAIGMDSGGVVGLLATVGVVAADARIGILGAMIIGPICGFFCKKVLNKLLEKTRASLQMLTKNLMIAVAGCIFCLFGHFVLAPMLSVLSTAMSYGIDYLISERWIVLSSIIIEPTKVLFLNNGVNHAILTPLGVQQVEVSGKSVLFLLETNPGPGLGVLLALLCRKKEKREQYAAGLFVQGIGGIHEVYFPFILSNLWLIFPLIAGGMAGTASFLSLGAGLQAPVSPGSILTILLMAGRSDFMEVLAGIGVSVVVSFTVAWFVLFFQHRWKKDSLNASLYEANVNRISEDMGTEDGTSEMEIAGKNGDGAEDLEMHAVGIGRDEVKRIGFLCDGGVGSSVMGAAIFRRQLKACGIAGIEVSAYAASEAPEDLDLIVCQKDFAEMLPDACRKKQIFSLDNLVSSESYTELLVEIQKRRGE
ncbi:MAG: PTS transporter subunit EIIC [Hespellia sp.]|nr:PTS transporter subunit EIIC [Hespellia sp.]